MAMILKFSLENFFELLNRKAKLKEDREHVTLYLKKIIKKY